jgi:hypothetical protein
MGLRQLDDDSPFFDEMHERVQGSSRAERLKQVFGL